MKIAETLAFVDEFERLGQPGIALVGFIKIMSRMAEKDPGIAVGVLIGTALQNGVTLEQFLTSIAALPPVEDAFRAASDSFAQPAVHVPYVNADAIEDAFDDLLARSKVGRGN